MKIVHILVGKANPHTMSGVNKVVHYLATEQHRSGHEVQVWGLTDSRRPASHEHEYKLRILPTCRSRFFLSDVVKAALEELSQQHRVHMHGVFIPEFPILARRLRRQGIPYGVSPHGGFAPGSLRQNGFAKKIFIALFDRNMLAKATLVHAVCEGERRDILGQVPQARVITVPNGQDLSFLEGFVAKPMPSPRPVFGFIGRLDMVTKGLDLLLEGFSYYKRAGGRGVLWLLGDGRHREELERAAVTLGLADNVVFLGARFKDEKLQAIANMDLVVSTSRRDVMPTGCLEAAAMGKPLLVSRETNLGDYVESFQSGIVLDENKPSRIADALKVFEAKYFAHDLGGFGRNSRAMIENELNWHLIAEKWTRTTYLEVCPS
jgi:glycosyltransferase involved in cell wall biosynthesis